MRRRSSACYNLNDVQVKGGTLCQISPNLSRSKFSGANSSGLTPVVFVHGLWLLPSSWDRWRGVFEEAGYVTLAPGWPDDPETVEEATAHPEVFANKTVGEIGDHFAAVIGKLDKRPVVIGHSFGGLITRWLPGKGSRRHRWRSTPPRSAACCLCRSQP